MKRNLILLLLTFLISGLSNQNLAAKPLKLLIFSKTNGYRHASIPSGLEALNKLATENNWQITASEDSSIFTTQQLSNIDLVIFLSTSGDVLGSAEQQALQHFVESGKGLLTIHSGTDTEYNWPWYSQAIGTHFLGHPPTQKAKVLIEDRNNPATVCFPDSIWEAEDEWYSFRSNPRPDVHVLVSMDEQSYDVDDNRWFAGAKQRMGDHPIVWYRKVGKGIVFQSGFGHTNEMFTNPVYLCHIKGAIEWITGNR
ncbi:MAG: ThuA domain-containing protein [Prolixibacteraceae bacterium]